MEITEVRVKLMEEPGERLKAFCSITFDDCFVVRDLKIIEGGSGPFVAMPSRKLTAHCPNCRAKNHLRASYCNQCGMRLKENQAVKDEEGRAKLYADIAHPINSECREKIQATVIDAFEGEKKRAKQPGYSSSYDDIDAAPALGETASPPKVQPKADAPHVQQPEQPRGPHTAPSHKAQTPHRPKKRDFGAGIFD
jgi:stage V sporulation protein G